MDYTVEAGEPIDLVGNCSCPSDGGQIAGNNSLGTRRRRDGVATSILVSPVYYNLMALADQ